MELAFLEVRSDPRYASELDLRYRVLRAPLGLGRHQVKLPGEDDALHLVATEGDAVLGCVLFEQGTGRTGRLRAMAVDPARQGTGLGRRLVSRLEAEVLERGVEEVHLHARALAIGFYERLGYAAYGEPFTEVGLPHRTMRKRLPR